MFRAFHKDYFNGLLGLVLNPFDRTLHVSPAQLNIYAVPLPNTKAARSGRKYIPAHVELGLEIAILWLLSAIMTVTIERRTHLTGGLDAIYPVV